MKLQRIHNRRTSYPRSQDGRLPRSMNSSCSSQKTLLTYKDFYSLIGFLLSLLEHTKLCHLVVQRLSTCSRKLSFIIWIILTSQSTNAAPLGQVQEGSRISSRSFSNRHWHHKQWHHQRQWGGHDHLSLVWGQVERTNGVLRRLLGS